MKNKCKICKKKIKPIIFYCKCKNMYCLSHLQPELHNCTYDFKKEGKEKLKEENPKIINKKIIKI
jgi:hypothetical protein